MSCNALQHAGSKRKLALNARLLRIYSLSSKVMQLQVLGNSRFAVRAHRPAPQEHCYLLKDANNHLAFT